MTMTDGASLDPSELDQASFELVRRGFDPLPVQRTLQRAAAVIRELRRERDVLAARVAEVEAVLSEPLEAHRVAEALGAEATQVLEAAHAAAAERANGPNERPRQSGPRRSLPPTRPGRRPSPPERRPCCGRA